VSSRKDGNFIDAYCLTFFFLWVGTGYLLSNYFSFIFLLALIEYQWCGIFSFFYVALEPPSPAFSFNPSLKAVRKKWGLRLSTF